MYSDMSFDTHKHIKEFVKAGMPELQAEAIVDLIRKSRDYDLSKLATKEQVVLLDQKIESSIKELEQKVESSTKELEQKIEFVRAESKADIERVEQRISHIEEKMAAKEDLSKLENQMINIFKGLEVQMSKFETQMAKQDAQQKSWMMGIFLSLAAIAVTLVLKLH